MSSEQLPPGLYEELVTVALGRLIDSLDETFRAQRPIAITWKLEHRLPADLFTEFAAAAVA